MMSWLWLALGAALLPFTLLQTTIPLAAWLAPLLLLRFSRTVRARWAVPALALAGALSTYASFRGGVMPTGQMLVAAAAGGAVLTPIPYVIDRLLAGRLTGIARTLVFPMADTAVVFLFGAGDFGTTGHVAGTQVGQPPAAAVGRGRRAVDGRPAHRLDRRGGQRGLAAAHDRGRRADATRVRHSARGSARPRRGPDRPRPAGRHRPCGSPDWRRTERPPTRI